MRIDLALLAGRLLLAAIFLDSGLQKFGSLDGVASALATKGLPWPWFGALAVASLEVLAASTLMAGVPVAPSALTLAGFTLAAGPLFHGFWEVEGAARIGERIHFLKNLSIVGGLLVLAGAGPGRLGLGARHREGAVT
jgi:putative oxidoreductase